MDETCREIDEAVQRWEREADADADDLSRIVAHTRQCARCRARHGALLPLLRRDTGEPVRRDPGVVVPSAGFTDGVMERIAAEHPPRLRSPSRTFLTRVLPIAAAALLAAGIGAGVAVLRAPKPEAEVLVRFTIQAPAASRVSLAGDFNGWQPGVLSLTPSREKGTWEITIPLRRGSVYTYDFVIDGEHWVADPGSRAQVDDGFGGLSSVLRL
ncbi:MAG TPA: isoamylase early set domain-containing protein [Spirochaetia bacterium]|nr:isoamylase early set domain-containing protein [Spirochaetia bacterium]